jgi:hypothetical protein
MNTTNIDLNKITDTIIEMTANTNKAVDMKADIKTDLNVIQGKGGIYNEKGELITEGSGMEFDLEAQTIDQKYELGTNTNLKTESTSTDFDLDIFKQIGLEFDRKNNKLALDFDKYSGKTSGNYLQNFSIKDQIKIISTYLKIESLRYANQQIYEKSKGHEKLFNILYMIAMVLNIVVPYLPDLVGYANTTFEAYSVYFAGASAIITFISYFFTRTLMSTVANTTNFNQMQQALTKLRLTVETIIMGSYLVDDGNVNNSNTQQLQIKYPTTNGLYDTTKGFNLSLTIDKIDSDLDSIYQFNSAFKENDIVKKVLGLANTETDQILKVFEIEITKAFEQINKLKQNLDGIPLLGQGVPNKIEFSYIPKENQTCPIEITCDK